MVFELPSEHVIPFVKDRITFLKKRIEKNEEMIKNIFDRYQKDLEEYRSKPFFKVLFSAVPTSPYVEFYNTLLMYQEAISFSEKDLANTEILLSFLLAAEKVSLTGDDIKMFSIKA